MTLLDDGEEGRSGSNFGDEGGGRASILGLWRCSR